MLNTLFSTMKIWKLYHSEPFGGAGDGNKFLY